MAIKNTNSRIGTSTNLPSGATYDLLMITYPDGFPEGQIKFDIDQTPRKITGVQKVAQTFMKLLLTSKGSDVIYPNRGTSFSRYTMNANRTDEIQVLRSELTLAVNDAASQTRIAMNSSKDPASQLAKVQIGGIDVGEESAVLYVQITTGAGVTAQVSVPFPELGLN